MSATEEADARSLLLVGFTGTEVDPDLRDLVRSGILGVILFGRNVESPAQVAALTADLKRTAAGSLLVAVDQEGGAVRRLRAGFSQVPSMRLVGAMRDAALAHRVGRLLGRELRAVGIDLDLAPVLDVDTNPDNPVIGARSFSSDPAWVSALGVALGRGLEWEGVGACAKHFPGHGDTLVDSHRGLPRLGHALPRLEAVELLPFRAWIQAGFGAIMTAHILFEAIDRERPATLSKAVISGLLRERLGYQGAVLTDDLEMRAIADHVGRGPAAVLAIEAGADVVLACAPGDAADEIAQAITHARRTRPGFEDAFQQARARAQALAARWAKPACAPQLERLATPEAGALLARIQPVSGPLGVDPTERPPAKGAT